MIKLEKYEVMGWEHAIRGMRNPMNSWEKSDSLWTNGYIGRDYITVQIAGEYDEYQIGLNDKDLMMKLRNAGTDHRKFMRMITVYVDITAPLYWWKEFDTYKVGTVANSCSTMHKIHEKEFTLEDFSYEHLEDVGDPSVCVSFDNDSGGVDDWGPFDILILTIKSLNHNRERFIATGDKRYWWQMIQLLPSSYNQKRTVMLNYEVLANIYKSRKHHKQDEWNVDCDGSLCKWIEGLPYSELITGDIDEKAD